MTLPVAAPAEAAEAQVWAFLVADRPSAQGTYVPVDQTASRTGISASVTRRGTGSYQVSLTGAGGTGVPMVTAVYRAAVHCQVASFAAQGPNEQVNVNCYAGTTPADSVFTLSFFESTPPDSGTPGAYGYVHNNQPTQTTYTNPPGYNSAGGQTHIYYNTNDRIWTVRFFGERFRTDAGNVQLTAMGATPARCAITQWYQHSQGLDAQVRCESTVRPQWTLVFAHERSIVGGTSGFFGYLQADQPSSPGVYTPSPPRNRAPNGYTHTVTRSGPGRYQAQVYGPLKEPAALHLTVNRNTDGFCTLTSWTITPSTQPAGRVDLTCYNAAGTPADQWFALNYFAPNQTT